MSDDPAVLARLLGVIADDLERRQYPAAGAVRRGARWIAQHPDDPPPSACPTCGAEVTQPGRGRPRVYCSQLCRNRAAKRQRNATVVA